MRICYQLLIRILQDPDEDIIPKPPLQLCRPCHTTLKNLIGDKRIKKEIEDAEHEIRGKKYSFKQHSATDCEICERFGHSSSSGNVKQNLFIQKILLSMKCKIYNI